MTSNTVLRIADQLESEQPLRGWLFGFVIGGALWVAIIAGIWLGVLLVWPER